MKKKILFIAAAVLGIAAGCQKYELNTDFSMPVELDSPSNVILDVTSSKTVVLSWNGGGAADGGVLLYNVLFDKTGGDFSEPLATMPSDLGAKNTLTLTHAQLNTLARKAGVKPNETGSFIWTVTASRGGVTKTFDGYASLSVVRGEGIDNIPEHLYVAGSAALEAGQEFRMEEEGLFVIYTELGAGSVKFTSEKDGGFTFFADETGKLAEGEGSYNVADAPSTGLARITVNFNTLNFKVEEIGKNVRAIWGANYADIAVLEYVGNGDFTGDGDVVFLGPGREGTPDWCSWVEERYYFIAEVEGKEVCWGSTFGSGAYTPDGTESFFYIVENPWEQWNNLWKMDHAFDMCHVTFVINTNKDNHMTHSYSGGAISYEQPAVTPAELFLNGDAAEAQGQAMMKDGDKFVIYNKLNKGNVSFVDGDGTKYFADKENGLFIGSPKTAVEASEGVTRIIVDFASKKVTFDRISATVDLRFAATADKEPLIQLSYQGLGKYAGEGEIVFLGPDRPGTPSYVSWMEERYYFTLTVNGESTCWGRLDSVSGENRPDNPETVDPAFWNLGEFSYNFTNDQWNHAWKMASELDESTATVTINTNTMTHSFQKASADRVPPTVAPADLTLQGTGAESVRAFRKTGDGVFEVVTKLSDGEVYFTSGSKKYFAGTDSGLLQGDGTTAVTAAESLADRIVVDFVNCTVKVEHITSLQAVWGADQNAFITFTYGGNGIFRGSGHITFFQPGDFDWLSWEEERYRYIVTIDGVEKCWGRLDSAWDQRPDNPSNYGDDFWQIGEFDKGGQWDHLWKFASSMKDSDVEITINADDNGVMTQTVTKK